MKKIFLIISIVAHLMTAIFFPTEASAQQVPVERESDLTPVQPIKVPDVYSLRTTSHNVYQSGLTPEATSSLLTLSLAYMGIGMMFVVIDLLVGTVLDFVQVMRRLFTRRKQFVYFGDWE